MAEVKNSFLGSKMNQDLDDRLVPSNEYREGLNISVSNSEDNDVGALQTILGNKLVASANNGETIIGSFVSEVNDTIFLFTTNYTDDSNNTLDNFAPSNSTCKIYSYNTLEDELRTIVSGFFLNFSTTHPIYGVNLLENLLFWTDNRNQPRKINIKTAYNNNSYYDSEDSVSVAKYAPFQTIQLYKETGPGTGVYETTMKDVVSEFNPDGTANPDYDDDYAGDRDYLANKFVRFSYRFKFDDGEYSIMAPFTQPAFIPKQDGSFIDKYNPDDLTELTESDEDDAYKSSIVKFMENKVNNIKLIIPFEYPANEISEKLKVAELEILYSESDSNLVKSVEEVPISKLSTADEFYEYDYQASKPVRVLPSDQTTRVYDKVPVKALGQEIIGNRVVYSNYVNKHSAPLTLDYSVNVSGKFASDIPHTSRALEEYPEHTLKENRNYQVGVVLSDRYGRQSGVILSENTSSLLPQDGNNYGSSTIYSPYKTGDPMTFFGDSLKMLFNSEITSEKSPLTEFDEPNETGNPGLYIEPGIGNVKTLGVQSIGSGYTSGTYDAYIDPVALPGRSGLKITISIGAGGSISGAIVADPGTGFEVGDSVGLVGAGGTGGVLIVASLEEGNPLGWYSYKIVVKQTEQEYYNVYVPDIIKGNIITSTAADQELNISYISLINDNINKVPRNLQEVGPDQRIFGSDTILFPRVDTPEPASNQFNKMFDVDQEGSFVNSIATLNDLTGTESNSTAVYQSESNPLIAKILTPYDVGKPFHNNTNFALGVFETEPFESLLDIYWETSTSGLISELNKAVRESTPDEPSYIVNWSFNLSEGDPTGTSVSSSLFQPRTSSGEAFTSTVVLSSVTNKVGTDFSHRFTLTGDSANGYNIQTAVSDFYYGFDADQVESYIFTLTVTNTDPAENIERELTLTGTLQNTIPSVNTISLPSTFIGMGNPITAISGENGSLFPQNKLGLSFTFDNGLTEITSYSSGTYGRVTFYLTATSPGNVRLTYTYDTQSFPDREIPLTIVLTDAGGATTEETITINFTTGSFDPNQFATDFNL